MSNNRQKQRLIQNYTLLAVECFCILLSFALAVLTRGVEHSYSTYSRTYITTIAWILFFHLLSYYLFDWNINFFKKRNSAAPPKQACAPQKGSLFCPCGRCAHIFSK